MKIVERQEVLKRLDMETCIGLMREAFIALQKGEAQQPVRFINQLPHGNQFGFMPAYLGDTSCFGAKVITVFHNNLGTEHPSHMGYVMLFEAQHGSFVGMADGSAITQVRTGAVSAVATDLLARKDAHRLAIVGAGAQGRSHLEAMLAVRPIDTVKVYDLYPAQAQKYQQEMEQKFSMPITICSSVQEAAKDADIICTLTPSHEAYLEKEWVAPGTHINAVGTCSPTTREVTSALFAAAKVYADQLEALYRESGEYLIPLKEGLITKEHIRGSLGSLLTGETTGRQNGEEITLFDALGLAVEDVMCAKYLLEA